MTAFPAQIQILRSRRELEALAADWDAMEQARANPLLSFRWIAAAASSLHEDATLHVVVVRRQLRLVAIAPMAWVKHRGMPWLEFIGAATLHEPAGLLADDEPALKTLCEALISARRPLVLQRIPADSAVLSQFRTCARGRGLLIEAGSAPCLRVEIAGSWDDYIAGRSTQVRSGLRRKRALLEQFGPVVFDSLRPTATELSAVFEEALDVEADGWKGAGGSAMRRNAPLRAFIRQLAERFASDGALRICFLRAGERAVAMSIMLEYDRSYWEIKIGYRESVRRASPGRQLLWETLRDAFARGLRRYEFLGSGDGQQPNWANASQPLHTLVYYPWHVRSIWAFGADALAHVARRLRR